MRSLLLAACLVFVARMPSPAQDSSPTSTPTVRKGHALDKIAVIGASLSEGYGSDLKWQAALEAAFTRPTTCALNVASSRTFFSPLSASTRQVGAAVQVDPSLVFAADFLFWFGYGAQGPDGEPIADESQRLALLEQGLALLERFECPVVVGDFPDMSAAVGSALMPQQMPAVETLTRLNERFVAWAQSRPNIVPIALSQWVSDARGGKSITIGETKYTAEQAASWIGEDNLHPSAAGMAALATSIGFELEKRKLIASTEHTKTVQETVERARRALAEAVSPAGGK